MLSAHLPRLFGPSTATASTHFMQTARCLRAATAMQAAGERACFDQAIARPFQLRLAQKGRETHEHLRSHFEGRAGHRSLAESRRHCRRCLCRRQGRRRRRQPRGGACHRSPQRQRVYRLAGPDRPPHPRLLGRHVARHRCRGILPDVGGHDRDRYRQRRAGQLCRFPQARHRAVRGAHPRLSPCLVRRHLRVLEHHHGRREREHAPDGARATPPWSRTPTAT